MNSFHEMGLHPSLTTSLDNLGFTTPTPIQAQTIPLAIQGKDVLGTAQTGTGKTLAFVAPIMSKLLEDPAGSALVLVPTRELAQQVMVIVKKVLSKNSPIKTALIIGGESIFKQIQQLRARPRIIVGTPGRVIDHLERKTFNPSHVRFLALDEADRMFDMGFGIQLEEIFRQLSTERQTLMFSATMADSIVKLAGKYLTNPERISIGSVRAPAAKIKQEVIQISESEKYQNLLTQLDQRDGSILVFVKTKQGAERLADKLCEKNHAASAIHGDLRQNKRERVIHAFRQGRHRIMVATDIAARGLDIPHIQHVINYDLPQAPEDYIHRIGRTARAGAQGSALCLITPGDSKKWKAICRLMQGSEPPTGQISSHQSNRPRGSKPFGAKGNASANKSRSDKPFGSKQRDEKSFDDKPFWSRQRDEKSFNDKPFGAKRRGEKSFDDKPFGAKRRGEKSFDDKPFGAKRRDEKSFDDKPFGAKRRDEKSFDDKPFGSKKRSERSFDDKPIGAKRRDEKTFDDKPFGDKRRGEKSFGDKPFGSKAKAQSNKPRHGSKPAAKSSAGNKPLSKRKAFKN